MEIVRTHTGKIYVDRDKKLEFLTVGDYGKENNIKADFLGLTKEINGVQHHEVDLSDKWVATISTQKGCPMHCKFCDCPTFGFFGNASREELAYAIGLENKGLEYFAEYDLRDLVKEYISADTIHPVVSTMLPKGNHRLVEYLLRWCYIKNEVYQGEAGLQFSINSTDEEQRKNQFSDKSLSLVEIAEIVKKLPVPVGRKYTLNFAVTKDTILDAEVLDNLFNKNHFIVKITPIHETHTALDNGFDVTTSYDDYDVYRQFEQPLVKQGWDVIVFVPSKEEDSDRITCGNALIAGKK